MINFFSPVEKCVQRQRFCRRRQTQKMYLFFPRSSSGSFVACLAYRLGPALTEGTHFYRPDTRLENYRPYKKTVYYRWPSVLNSNRGEFQNKTRPENLQTV